MPRELQPSDSKELLKALVCNKEGRTLAGRGKGRTVHAMPHSMGLRTACELALPDQVILHVCRSGAIFCLAQAWGLIKHG